jgi:hypothetical protein
VSVSACVFCGHPSPKHLPDGCVFCGQDIVNRTMNVYCSTWCAERQLATLVELLCTTPRLALSVLEWHDLSEAYASDLEHMALVTM